MVNRNRRILTAAILAGHPLTTLGDQLCSTLQRSDEPSIGLVGIGNTGRKLVERFVRERPHAAERLTLLAHDARRHDDLDNCLRMNRDAANRLSHFLIVHALGGRSGGDHVVDWLHRRWRLPADFDHAIASVTSLAVLPFEWELGRYAKACEQDAVRRKIPGISCATVRNGVSPSGEDWDDMMIDTVVEFADAQVVDLIASLSAVSVDRTRLPHGSFKALR